MDLRSAHKVLLKPAPRIRLSLSRSLEIDQIGRRCREGYRRLEKRRPRIMDDVKPFQQLTRSPIFSKDFRVKEWDRVEEIEQKKQRMTINDENTDMNQDIPSGRCCAASIRQLLLGYTRNVAYSGVMRPNIVKKVKKSDGDKCLNKAFSGFVFSGHELSEGYNSSTEQEPIIIVRKTENRQSSLDHSEKPIEDTCLMTGPVLGATDGLENRTITETQLTIPVTNTAGGGDSEHDATNTDQSLQNSTNLETKVEGVPDKIQNRPSVIEVHMSAKQEMIRETGQSDTPEVEDKKEMDVEVTEECKTTLQVPTDQSQASSTIAVHTGKVIVTKVTINSLTVTFKEAMSAQGFFSDCALEL